MESLPAELLVVVLHIATHFDHPRSLDDPLINWHSQRTMFFGRTLELRRLSLATKAAVVLVCRRWNAVGTPWLYEHIAIDSKGKMDALHDALSLELTRIHDLGRLTRRLDIELAEEARDFSYPTVANLLPKFPNVRTLVMILPKPDVEDAPTVLPHFPPLIKRLYWSVPMDRTLYMPPAPSSAVFGFLYSHAHLEVVSFPFHLFYDVLPPQPESYPKPIREWVVRSGSDFLTFEHLRITHKTFPQMNCRTLTCDIESSGLNIAAVVGDILPRSLTFPADRLGESSIARLNLTVELHHNAWPPRGLNGILHSIAWLCPNLREMGFSFVSDREEIFSAAMLPPTGRVVEVPQVEVVSIQRVRRDSELPDRVGTLHHTLSWLPWLAIFPGLKTIRIREDLDFDQLKSHPTTEFVRGKDWIIAIEDRFGEAIF